jgi:hypothetical protein
MSKNAVEPEGPQMTSQRGAYELYAGEARLHARMRAHTHTNTQIYNMYFFRGSNDSRTPLSITLYIHLKLVMCPPRIAQ